MEKLRARRRVFPYVLGEAAGGRTNQMSFAGILVGGGFADSTLLPYEFTRRVSGANWRCFDAGYLPFAMAGCVTGRQDAF